MPGQSRSPPRPPRPQARPGTLPAAVLVLGVVSLLTDLSSEMIYPLLPLYLSTVLGAGPVALGLVEGVAESTASLLKLVSGVVSDRSGRRKPLVAVGYTLSSMARPLIGLAGSWPAVLGLRFADRVGKGLRTSPRDALIADIADEAVRGRAYGLHRAFDHTGAVLGPLVATALLLGGLSLRGVFLAAAVPAAAVVLVVWLGVREPPRVAPPPSPVPGAATPTARQQWAALGGGYKRLLAAVLLFTLGNSTDAFLLLQLSQAGLAAGWIAALWSLQHAVKATAVYGGGHLADRVGQRRLMIVGWGLYAVVYAGFGTFRELPMLVALFLAYGLYAGCTEPAERAWVAALVPEHLRGSAFGAYHGTVGLAALPASLLFGLLLQQGGPAPAFYTGAGLALGATLLLLRVPAQRDGSSSAGTGTA